MSAAFKTYLASIGSPMASAMFLPRQITNAVGRAMGRFSVRNVEYIDKKGRYVDK